MNRRSVLVFAGLAVSAGALLAHDQPLDQSPDRSTAAPSHQSTAATGLAPATPWAAPAAEAAAAAPTTTWRADQVLVTLHPDVDLDALAADHAAAVLRRPGRAGLAVLSVPDGQTAAEAVARLRNDDRVQLAGRQGVIRGASGPTAADQWHLQAGDFDETPSADLSGFVVAVLDTGVAYEDYQDRSGTYLATPCLRGAAVVSPRDVVHQDDHPNDDHQHGTHIASTIVADCAIQGSAPGAVLMPVKVLDADNLGLESDLIEGIYWAIDHGADVINMSLTFGQRYVPSAALQRALADAADAGIVLVGAAGNDGSDRVGWPAASPDVIAVGAGCPIPNHDEDLTPAPYSNRGLTVDVVAGGGCMDRDDNADGVPDGVLAESFPLNDPTDPGLWLFAGTSQAAAVTSGAAVRLLAGGVPPEDVRPYLHVGAEANIFSRDVAYAEGLGKGAVDIEDSIQLAARYPHAFHGTRYRATMLPLLRDNGDGTVTPGAQWTVLDATLHPAADVIAGGTIRGERGRIFGCHIPLGAAGTCVAWGDPVAAVDRSGPRALAWEMSLDLVIGAHVAHQPSTLMLVGQSFLELTEDLARDPELAQAVLGVAWGDGDAVGPHQMAESYAILNAGTGISTSPFGVVMTPPSLPVDRIQAGGTGISTSPFGLRILELEPAVATGLETITVVAIEGKGISTSPFGVLQLPLQDPAGGPVVPLELTEDPPAALSGTALASKMQGGGWQTAGGEAAGHAVVGSGVLDGAMPVTDDAPMGAGVGAEPYPE